VRRKRLEDIPVEVLDFIDGYVFLAEETPEFIARASSAAQAIRRDLEDAVFRRPRRLRRGGNQLWTCPGHNGGIFYNRSPIGRIFVQHLGEAVFRDDLDNSVLELGDLLTHEGPRCRRRKKLPPSSAPRRLFRAQRHVRLEQDRAVGAGRRGRSRAFRSQQPQGGRAWALFLGGAIPIFLETDRNAYA